jgi:hypothetical protein
MNSSGEVGIGDSPVSGTDFFTPEAKISILGVNTNPSATYKLNTNGQVQFSYDIATSLKIDCYLGPYELSLYPASNNCNYLGRSTAAFKRIWTYTCTQLSDARQKENITDITGALATVLGLRGVKYDIKKEFAYDESKIFDEEYIAIMEKDRKNKIGFLAQEVYSILPEVVVYDDSADVYGLNYSEIVPILVEAIKEQQAEISSLRIQVNFLLSPSPEFKGASADLESIDSKDDGISELFQNTPNPFTEETNIKYNLAEEISSAYIYIYDMTGKQLVSHNLGQERSGEIIISGGELDAGIYMYSMVADGRLIGTKQMLLTD